MADPKESARYRASLERQRDHLEKHREAAGIARECLQPIVDCLLPRYAEADATAVQNQSAFRMSAVAVYGLSSLAVTIAIVQLLFLPQWHQFIWLEVAAMIAALLLIAVSRRGQWQRQWLQARHLAEQLRAAMFVLILPGDREAQEVRPVQVLPFYESPDPRLQEKIRAVLRDPSLTACAATDLDSAKRFIIEGWILDQAQFHQANAHRSQRAEQRTRWAAIVLFTLTLIAAALHAWGVGHGADDAHREHAAEAGVLTVGTILITITLPAWGAALHGVADLFELERIGQRSRRMEEALRRKARATENAASFDELRGIAAQTEWLMAMENYEWLVSLGFRRPPDVPG